VDVSDKRMINARADVNQLLPLKYRWAWEKYLSGCAKCESLGLDEGELFNAYREVPSITDKAAWALKHTRGLEDRTSAPALRRRPCSRTGTTARSSARGWWS
jgi:hypothetical protein